MNTKQPFETPAVESNDVDLLSRKLFEANVKLISYEKERHDLLSNIFHDIRAPLTAIRSGIDLLQNDDSLDAKRQSEIIKLLDRRCKTLETLTNDMYYLCVIENKDIPFDLKKVDALSFLEEFFFSTELNSIYDNKELSLPVSESLDCTINIDIEKTVRVLDNLFVNAAKYSDDGASISLDAHIDNNFLCILVSDTGFGISEEDLPNIFNRSYMVESARTQNKLSSSGLGLSIAKTIIERENGTLTATSKLGVGSVFEIRLPIV